MPQKICGMAMSLDQADMFDELGDKLMLQLSNSMNDSATVTGIVPFLEIVDHPQFINAEMLIHSLSTENLKIPFKYLRALFLLSLLSGSITIRGN